MSKVAVAIPTYNRKDYLRECLKSIFNQTFQDFLIYVFDNGSDYDVVGLLKEFNNDRIVLLRNDRNIGGKENFRRILGYKFSSEYLIVFHDDDTMHSLLLEKEVNLLDKYKNVVFVGTDLKFVKNHKKMLSFSEIKDEENFYIYHEPADLIRLILKDFDLCYGSVMYRTDYIEDTWPNDDRFFKWRDRPYLIELSKKGKTAVLKEKLVNYRIHQDRNSQLESLDKSDYLFNLFLFYKENLPKPLNKRDKKLFYSFATNNLILSGFSFSKNWQEYKNFLKEAKKNGIFDLRYLNFRGIYYFLKGIKKLYFQKNE